MSKSIPWYDHAVAESKLSDPTFLANVRCPGSYILLTINTCSKALSCFEFAYVQVRWFPNCRVNWVTEKYFLVIHETWATSNHWGCFDKCISIKKLLRSSPQEKIEASWCWSIAGTNSEKSIIWKNISTCSIFTLEPEIQKLIWTYHNTRIIILVDKTRQQATMNK